MKTRPRKLQDPKKVQAAVDQYFKHCEDTMVPVQAIRKGQVIKYEVPKPRTLAGLAVALGINDRVLVRYEDDENHVIEDDKDRENLVRLSTIIAGARAKIKEYILEQAALGGIEPRIATLMLTSNHDMALKSEVKGTGTLNCFNEALEN